MEGIAKANFSQELQSGILSATFYVFWLSLGALLMNFGAAGAGLNFHGFSGLPGGIPELRKCTSGW